MTLNSNQAKVQPCGRELGTMAVHRISLFGAVLIFFLAIVFLFLIGPLGLLFLILVAILLWYAFGPGSRTQITVS